MSKTFRGAGVPIAGEPVTTKAINVSIEDTNNYFASDNVEGSLQEIGILSTSAIWGRLTGTLSEQTDLQAELDAKEPADATILKDADIGVTVSEYIKNNYTATVAPTVNNDETEGYSVGSEWIDSALGDIYRATDVSTGAAVWADVGAATVGTMAYQDSNAVSITGGTISGITSLGVSGNITVTGTVDGRDVAADGTKLDGIELNATADQTAGEIEAIVSHDNLLGFVTNEHIDWTIDQGVTNIHSGNYTNTTDHTALSNIGTNSHPVIDNHIADGTLHYTQASISITESQISDFGSYLSNIVEDLSPTLGGNLDVSGNSIIDTSATDLTLSKSGSGDLVLANSGSGSISIEGDELPATNNTYDLGASGTQWDNLYARTIYEDGTLLTSKYIQTTDVGIDQLRSQGTIAGGGTVETTNSRVYWDEPFMVWGAVKSSIFSSDNSGIFEIDCPVSGSIYEEDGTTVADTATSEGVNLAVGESLWYELPIGSAKTSVQANFRIVYDAVSEQLIDKDWVLVCARIGSVIYFPNRRPIDLHTSSGVVRSYGKVSGIATTGTQHTFTEDGLTIQTGNTTVAGNSTKSITLPSAYGNTEYSVLAEIMKSGVGLTDESHVYSKTNTAFSIVNGESGTQTFQWIAIGKTT